MSTKTNSKQPRAKGPLTSPRSSRPAPKKSVLVHRAIPGLMGKGLVQLDSEFKLELRERLNMARPVFRRLVDVSERTIAKVESETETAEKLERHYNQLYRLIEALDDVIDVRLLGAWFLEPNDAFGRLKPIELIERGEIDRLWNMIFQLRTGMPG